MDWIRWRGGGVEEALPAPVAAAPADADVAFEALYRSSRDDVFRYVAGLLRDRSAAEEVTAAAFERAYRKRGSFDSRRGTPRAWLFGIARNAALDELRRRSRIAEMAVGPDADEAGADEGEQAAPDEAPDVALRRAALRGAMPKVTPRERELVALKFFAGLSNGEIASVIGASETNAGTRLHRVIEKLRRACDEAV